MKRSLISLLLCCSRLFFRSLRSTPRSPGAGLEGAAPTPNIIFEPWDIIPDPTIVSPRIAGGDTSESFRLLRPDERGVLAAVPPEGVEGFAPEAFSSLLGCPPWNLSTAPTGCTWSPSSRRLASAYIQPYHAKYMCFVGKSLYVYTLRDLATKLLLAHDAHVYLCSGQYKLDRRQSVHGLCS